LNYGFVVDFLDVYVASWHWPTFNVADIAISAGAGIVIVDILGLFRRRAEKALND
jgi:signal peptidase II